MTQPLSELQSVLHSIGSLAFFHAVLGNALSREQNASAISVYPEGSADTATAHVAATKAKQCSI